MIFHRKKRLLLKFFSLTYIITLHACISLPSKLSYSGPSQRPPWVNDYYAITDTYQRVQEKVLDEKKRLTIKRIELGTTHLGSISLDYYQLKKTSDDLILIFPILGGKKYPFEKYFAKYFASHGLDTVILHRDDGFKDPKNSDHLEEIFRQNVIRDRLVLNFFEQQYHKKNFGTFGLSRGGINVAITAGVDKRFKYNVIVLGGSDILGIFRDSEQKGIKRYRKEVLAAKGISEDELYSLLRKELKTDPKYVAPFIDARNTLMFLSLFDRTVPFEYGMQLRKQIGKPRTIFLLADHYTSLLYTQFFPVLLPTSSLCLFPFDYIENEALGFFQQSFHGKTPNAQSLAFSIFGWPLDAAQSFSCAFQKNCRDRFSRKTPKFKIEFRGGKMGLY